MRDEFTIGIKEELAKRVGYLCSNPGPRYDDSLSSGERGSCSNGIWLCQTCAKLVDSDQSRYTVDKLRVWKSDAEAAAARALERRRSPVSGSEGVFLEAERLMPDLIAEIRSDVRGDKTGLIREFVPLHNRNVRFGHTKPRFVYYQTKHPHLQLQLDWLEEMGVIVDITPKSSPIYRMTPEFADWLHGATQPLNSADEKKRAAD